MDNTKKKINVFFVLLALTVGVGIYSIMDSTSHNKKNVENENVIIKNAIFENGRLTFNVDNKTDKNVVVQCDYVEFANDLNGEIEEVEFEQTIKSQSKQKCSMIAPVENYTQISADISIKDGNKILKTQKIVLNKKEK